jgi:hypothetical protein
MIIFKYYFTGLFYENGLLQEAEMRKYQRLEAIAKANDLMYEQTDKMKMLRSQALYCDVLHTRVGQIDDKKKTKEAIKVENQHYHTKILEKVAAGEEAERKKTRGNTT